MNDEQRKFVEENYDLIESVAAEYSDAEEKELAWESAAEELCALAKDYWNIVDDYGMKRRVYFETMRIHAKAEIDKHRGIKDAERCVPSDVMERMYSGMRRDYVASASLAKVLLNELGVTND